ncbi:prolyl oligopeptidase family protein [Sphingosinicella rhizophila]|uniref:Peptidase S9A N-terminal domain-containing protein n=1 Tax=Sphingosinicella rhizophila TaxID=3050082 RepID=A0ABU3Q9W2_9SPHN|nr:hypothetical protein [Sphingosinicella sp. GR2756]MDT9600201.1 hypothetical protein [Sphingosinicella sp. GR2756]
MPDYPPARREDVIKTVGGVSYPDPYAWLHEDSEEALAYGWAQNAIAEQIAKNSPRYEAVKAEVLHWQENGSFLDAPRLKGGWWFWTDEGNERQRTIALVRNKDGGEPRIIADTISLAAGRTGGEESRLMYLDPSPQGRFAALFFADATLANGEWRVVETATGRLLPVALPAFALGNRPGWLPNESGFFVAARTPEGGNLLRFVPVTDEAEAFEDLAISDDLLPEHIPSFTPQVSPDGRRVVLSSEPHERIAMVLVDLVSRETRAFLPAGWPNECDGAWLDPETYVARITGDAPRGRVVAIPVATSQDAGSWRELVAEGEGAMRFAGLCAGRLVVADLVDTSVRFRTFDADGSNEREVPLEAMGSSPASEFQRTLRSTDALAIMHQTFFRSIATYVYDFDSGALSEFSPPKHRLNGIHVEQRFATSKDGTRIPYSIVRRDGPRQGPQPTWSTAMVVTISRWCRAFSATSFRSSRREASMSAPHCAAAVNMAVTGMKLANSRTSIRCSRICSRSRRI